MKTDNDFTKHHKLKYGIAAAHCTERTTLGIGELEESCLSHFVFALNSFGWSSWQQKENNYLA
jgi:hypothetical protein